MPTEQRLRAVFEVCHNGGIGGGHSSRAITWSCQPELHQSQSIRHRASVLPNRKGSSLTGMGLGEISPKRNTCMVNVLNC